MKNRKILNKNMENNKFGSSTSLCIIEDANRQGSDTVSMIPMGSKVWDDRSVQLYNKIEVLNVSTPIDEWIDPNYMVSFKDINNNKTYCYEFNYFYNKDIDLNKNYQILGYYLISNSRRDKIKLCKCKDGTYVIKNPYFDVDVQDYVKCKMKLAKGDVINLAKAIKDYKKNNRVDISY